MYDKGPRCQQRPRTFHYTDSADALLRYTAGTLEFAIVGACCMNSRFPVLCFVWRHCRKSVQLSSFPEGGHGPRWSSAGKVEGSGELVCHEIKGRVFASLCSRP